MHTILCILLIAVTMNLQIIREDDGATCGELWYKEKMVWRVSILPDGARPVSGVNSKDTTLIIPDLINGLFLIKIQ